MCCFFCWKKGDRALPKHDVDPSKKSYLIEFIEKFYFPEFQKYASILPLGQCGSCRVYVSNHMKKGENALKHLTKSKDDYMHLIQILQNLPPLTRENPVCKCLICNIMKQTPIKSNPKASFTAQPVPLPLSPIEQTPSVKNPEKV